jgi:hypothetical protein
MVIHNQLKGETIMLNKDLKEKLIDLLQIDRLGCMFGDGQEVDYIMDGCHIVGLNQMSDEELVQEYEDNRDDDDEFLKQLKFDLESHKMLSNQ